LHRVGGNLRISIYVRVYSGIKYVVQLNLSVRPEDLQATEESAGSLLLSIILKKGILKDPPECLAVGSVHQQRNILGCGPGYAQDSL